MAILGTCSICKGPVSICDVWMGIIPPKPQCQRCGATKRNPYGPSIEMENEKTDNDFNITSFLKGFNG